jgi:predicted aspartyl protease
MPSIALVRSAASRLPFISLKIDGSLYYFLVDTGADRSLLDHKLIDHLRTKRHGMIIGAGGIVPMSSVSVNFNLLHKTLTEVIKLSDADKERLSSRGLDVSGIIGQDLLSQFSSYTIDNKKRQFTFTL